MEKIKNDIKWMAMSPKLVNLQDIYSNDYNPNRMPDAEMDLLISCIKKYGFLFPILVAKDSSTDRYRIVDGFHRFEALRRIGADKAVVIELPLSYHDAIQLTVLMNRIKGLHQVELMSDLVVKLADLGLQDSDIAKNLGMEAEELIRLKQQLGISHSFKDCDYSMSWKSE